MMKFTTGIIVLLLLLSSYVRGQGSINKCEQLKDAPACVCTLQNDGKVIDLRSLAKQGGQHA